MAGGEMRDLISTMCRTATASLCQQRGHYLQCGKPPALSVHGVRRFVVTFGQTAARAPRPSAVVCLTVQISEQKYFASGFGRSRLIDSSYPVPGNEGRTRRHERWVGMRWTLM